MPSARMRVVVTRRLPAPVEARMQELFDVTLNADDRPMTAEEIAARWPRPTCWSRRSPTASTRGCSPRPGPQLRLIANYGAGFDHIDVATALQRGIMVSNTPGVLAEDTADMAMALILAVPRRLPEGWVLMQRGEWQGWSPTALMGHRIAGKSLGILGLGRIGRAIARRARTFGLDIHYHNRRRLHPDIEAELGAHLVGEPRPDAGADRHPERERAAHALDLPPDERPAAEADEARPPTSSTPPAAR